MASKRMFAHKIIDSARFLKMPLSSQLLYFHLAMRADDDGVVEGYNILRMTGINEDDLKVLATKGFIKVLNEDLVAYITDWREHNSIRADRKTDSLYKDLLLKVVPEVDLLERKSKNKKLLSDICQSDDCQMSVSCQSDDSQVSVSCQSSVGIEQTRLDKTRLDKTRLEQLLYIKNLLKCSDAQVKSIIKLCEEKYKDVDAVVVVEEKLKLIKSGNFNKPLGALVAAIKENWSENNPSIKSKSASPSSFVNFEARDIDYKDLEDRLSDFGD